MLTAPCRSSWYSFSLATVPLRGLPPSCQDVEADIVHYRWVLHGRDLFGHRDGEGFAIQRRQPLEVLAQHHRFEEAGQLFYRTKLGGLFVQPGLNLYESGGLQTGPGGFGVGVLFGVLPTLEVIP